MQKESFIDRCSRYFSTCFGLGFLYAPGTVGSLFATILHYAILSNLKPKIFPLLLFDTILIAILFIVGLFAITSYLSKNKTKKDPKEVILDEVIGQLLSFNIYNALIILTTPKRLEYVYEHRQVFIHVACILLFRLFDILKPWPINIVDQKITNAFGIIADDVLAGLFAGLIAYLLTLLVF